MKEFYIDGYDVVEQFPDDTPDNVIQETLNKAYPETDDQFVSRIADPATPASAVSFEDFQRYQELKPELSVGDLAGLVAQGAGVVASELMNGVRSTLNLAAQGQLGEMGTSLAEGAARGTYDLGNLAMRIGDNLNTYIEPYIQDTGDAKKDQYNRFLAIKEMDSIREAARKGDSTILSRFGISADPASINTEMAEAASYFLDPTVLVSGGSTKVGSFINKALGSVAAKPAELASRATGAAARGLSSLESKVAEKAGQLAKLTEETTGGLGKYALPGGVGALAGSVGLAPAAGVGAGVAMAVPTLEVASGLFKGFANSLGNMPTRIGPLHHLAMNSPQTRAGKMAGRLKFLDPVSDLAGRTAGGAVQGAAYGAGLGALAGGMEGAAQGLGAGGVLGAGAGGFSRVAEGLSGVSKRRAEANDYQTWYTQQPREVKDFMDQNVKSEQARVQVMDGWQMFQTALGDEADIRIISDDDFRARFQKDKDKATGAGVQVVEGERPVLYINGQKGNTTTLFHEMFHGIARLDGFDGLVSNISSELGKMYSPAEINQFVKEYEASGIALKGREGLVTTDDKFSAIMEELGAEHFANFIQGKDSSYLLKGSPLKDALSGFVNRFVAGKLDRIYDTFESPIFKSHLKRNRALDRAMNDLVKARRKAYKQVELSADDYIRAYGENDLGDDNVFNELQALGVAELDNKGKRVIKSNYRIGKETKELGKQLKDALAGVNDAGGMLKQSDGSYKGRNFSPDQLRALLDAPFLSDKVKEVIQFIADIRQSGSDAVNVTYGAATYKNKRGRTKYRNLPISNRDALIYGLTVSPVGTVTANILDLSLLRSKIQRLWSGDSRLHNLFDGPDGMYNDALTYVNALGGDVPTAQVLGSAEKRNHLNKMLGVRNVKGNPELPDTYNLKEADHPWRSFRLDRFVKARKLEDVNAQFSQQAYEMAQGNFSPGQTGVIRESDIARFSPAPDNPNASLRDFVGKKVQVLTSDLSTGKDKKVDGITVSFRGGPAYLEMFDGWAFTNEGSAKAFRTRWERDGKPLIGITSMLPNNHLNSKLARRYYAAKWRELVEAGKISESTVNKHLRAAMKRVVSGKNALTSDQRKMIANVKTHHDFAKVFEMIPWKAAPTVYEKLAGKTLPIPAKRQEALGVDLDSIAEATREPAYADVGPGHLLAIAEYNGSDPVYKPDLNENYPWMVELKEKAFLDEFHEVTGMTSREDVQTKSGKPNTAVLMGAGVTLDKLHSGDVRFSPGQTSPAQSAAEIKQWAESHTSDQLRNSLSSMRLTPTSKMLELIGSFPEYLNPVVDYVVGKRQALVEGKITPRDVAKAYWITLSSIGADAIDLSTIQKKASALGLDFRPDEMFLSKGKKGQDQMRPEELAAWWLGTESGQKALNAIERGVIDMDAWEVGMAMRDAFGRQDFRPTDKRVGGLGEIKARNEFNLSNILPLTDEINKAKGDPKKLERTLLKIKGISDGKKGFIGHLLGLGDFPTIDAVELNVWLTGKGSTTFATQEAKKRVSLAKKASASKPLREDLFRRIVGRIKELKKASPEGSKIPESVAPHIIHHWIWDAAKGVQTTHAGLYHAMVHFSPARTLNKRGGAIYTTEQGHRAVQTSSRAGVRVYDNNGKRIGPVFQSVEKAERYLQSKAK
jgi:hypothetical protein